MSTAQGGAAQGRRRAMRAPHWLCTVGLVALAAGCAKRWDGTPQIEVSPRAAERAGLIGRAPGGAPKRATPTARAHARAMTAGDALSGASARGAPGDWRLANDEVVFVLSHGALVDVADAKARVDELDRFTPLANVAGLACDGGTGRDEEDGTARVTFSCTAEGLRVETSYALARSDRAMLVSSTLRAAAEREVTLPALVDRFAWGALRPFATGHASPLTGDAKGPFVGGIGAASSVAYTSTEGRVDATTVDGVTELRVDAAGSATSSQGLQLTRVIAVGERPDSSSLVTELTRASGGDVGAITVTLVNAAGSAVPVTQGAEIALAVGKGRAEIMRIVAVRGGDRFDGELPPGRYELWLASPSGAGARETVEVRKGATTRVAVTVPLAP
jgi:hypothetical protein